MPKRSNLLYARGGTQMPPTLDGLPLLKPPYGRVTAIDLNKGDTKWVARGRRRPAQPSAAEGPEPAARWARRSAMRAMVTKSAVVRRDGRGQSRRRPQPAGRRPPAEQAVQIEPTKFRVYDKATGAPLWDIRRRRRVRSRRR